MSKLLRFILLLPFIPLICAFSYEAFLFFKGIEVKDIVFFLLGIGVYLLVYVVLLSGRIGFLETLEHELTHAAASLAVFHMPRKLVVDPEGGGKKAGVTETIGCFWVALAPYFLPLFTLPLLLLEPVVPSPFDRIVDSLIGFTLAFHYVRLGKDLRVKQSDITDTGAIFSFFVSVFLNLVFLVVVLAAVTGNYSGILEYFRASFATTKEAYKIAYEIIKSWKLPTLQGFPAQGE